MLETMLQKAKEVRVNAYAPYSNFKVGACVEAEDGTLFVGCNVENASYGLTICAEVVAIGSMIAAGKSRIKSILIMGTGDDLCAPCGRCRQVINEFADADAPIYICNEHKVLEVTNIAKLLPFAFGPHNLEKSVDA